MTGRVIVIGVGNEYRRDDALGPTVVERLRNRRLRGVELAECDGEASRLIELWEGADLAVVVDAVHAHRAQPGRVHRLSAHHPAATPAGAASTHGVDLGEGVALARALHRMPARLLLYAVEVADTGFGMGLTPAVAAAAERVADEIAKVVNAATQLWLVNTALDRPVAAALPG